MTNPLDPAYPVSIEVMTHTSGSDMYLSGLTKREYFAAMAMNATAESVIAFHKHNEQNQKSAAHIMASYWVCLADALIAELNKEKSSNE